MFTRPAGGQFPPLKLDRLSACARGFPIPSVRMVAVATGPENKAISGSKPPAGITVPAALIPPPKPNVSMVTVEVTGNVKVCSKMLVGVASVPVYDTVFGEAGGTTASSAKVRHGQSVSVVARIPTEPPV